MDEKDWLILKTLQEKKSITKTAATMFISQPALSKRLQQIEERFGVTLAMRSKTGIKLTSEGDYLAACACELLEKVRSMDESIRGMRDDLQGTLRIGATHFITRYILPDILMRFKELHPQVEFHLVGGWSSDISRMALAGDLHVGFIRNESVKAENKLALIRERTYVCSRKPINMTRLPEEPQIAHRTDSLVRAKLNAWWNDNYSIPPRVSMEVDQVSTCAEMVARGLGYGILSELPVSQMPDVHKHEIFHKNGEPYFRYVWLTYSNAARQLKFADRFIDFVAAFEFGNELDALRVDRP